MKSPFKLLDSYTFADRDKFFGRDKEIEELHKMVSQTSLLVLYGLSGTGKTSLIQCGLANKFDGPDWLPLFIRRQNNINESLQFALEAAMSPEEDDEEELGTNLVEQVQAIYRTYLRPVYLIFDQFEELFILGSPEEKDTFIQNLRTLLDTRLRCKVILSMREEYLGQLYDFEKVIPTLFDFRLRLDPMNNSKVKEVIQKSFAEFNILLEDPEEARLEQMMDNLSIGKQGVPLPYLQVYLDRLYREDFRRTFNRDRIGNELPLLTFTQAEIAELGEIENVLEKFLQEQETTIQAALANKYPQLPPEAVRQVLDAFVTEEGTKRPVRFRRVDGQLVLDEKMEEWLPKMPPAAMTECLDELERSRLLRFTGENMELAHDSLAELIDRQRTDQQRQLNNLRRSLQANYEDFLHSGEYLSRRQLNALEAYLPELHLEKKVQDFIDHSRQHVTAQEQQEVERQKRELRRTRRGLLLTIVLLLIASVLGIRTCQQQVEVVAANTKLREQVRATTLANVASFRNEGKYADAIAQIDTFQRLVEGTDLPLDSQLLVLRQVGRIAATADSLLALPDTLFNYDRHLLAALSHYEQADRLSTDGNLRSKISQTQAAIERAFAKYKDSGVNLYRYGGGCKQALPVLQKAERLRPGDAEVREIMQRCQ